MQEVHFQKLQIWAECLLFTRRFHLQAILYVVVVVVVVVAAAAAAAAVRLYEVVRGCEDVIIYPHKWI